MSPPSIAYVAGGKLHLKVGDAPVRAYESAFAQQVRDRHVEIHQRHSWKQEGRGARFMSGLLWGGPERDPAQLRMAITSLTRDTFALGAMVAQELLTTVAAGGQRPVSVRAPTPQLIVRSSSSPVDVPR